MSKLVLPVNLLIVVIIFFVDIGFSSFLPNFAESLVSLLESGADREPEIIEQVKIFFVPASMLIFKFQLLDIWLIVN